MQPIQAGRPAILILLALLLLSHVACNQNTIREINADPSRYAHIDVEIVGDVVESYSILGRGAYQVDDGTGRIWVVSEKGVPRKGSRVAVKGKVRDAFNLGAFIKLPQEVSSGIVMVEEEHRAKS